MIVDLLYGETKCRVHAEPAWLALPDELRGHVIDRSKPVPAPHRQRLDGHAVLVASTSDARAASRRGYRAIALLEHGIGQSYEGLVSSAYPGGAGRDMIGLFLAPNETAAGRDRAAYPDATVAVVGSPRLDTLPRHREIWGLPTTGGDHEPVVAVSFHWSMPSPPEMKSAWSHYRAALPALAERFSLIGHCHPMAARELIPEYRRMGIEVVEDFDEVCRRADVYVCDNSSTLYEFASTDRPVVVLNAPWYRLGTEHGLRFWSAANVGLQCDEPADLGFAVATALEDEMFLAQARERALDVAYAYRTGGAQRAADAIAEWAT